MRFGGESLLDFNHQTRTDSGFQPSAKTKTKRPLNPAGWPFLIQPSEFDNCSTPRATNTGCPLERRKSKSSDKPMTSPGIHLERAAATSDAHRRLRQGHHLIVCLRLRSSAPVGGFVCVIFALLRALLSAIYNVVLKPGEGLLPGMGGSRRSCDGTLQSHLQRFSPKLWSWLFWLSP